MSYVLMLSIAGARREKAQSDIRHGGHESVPPRHMGNFIDLSESYMDSISQRFSIYGYQRLS
jgi:hypothetical protein